MALTDEDIEESLRDAYCSGHQRLVIFSRYQDVGIWKCAWGVEQGLLEGVIVEVDEQSTLWEFRFTAKAGERWGAVPKHPV